MIVTAITGLSGSRFKVEIDHQFAFVLYKGELHKYHIEEEQHISEEVYREIVTEVIPKRAKKRCMNLLQNHMYTEAQLREKLAQGFYSEEVIEEAIAYVSSFRYIDDLRYAEDYIITHEDVRSRRRIMTDLCRKGISTQIIEQAFLKWEEQGGKQDEQAMIQALLEKRKYDPETASLKDKQSLYAFLMRKGYSSELARRAIE